MKTCENCTYDLSSPSLPYSVDANKKLNGSLSLPYGMARKLAFRERNDSTRQSLRILFGEAGRRSVPWGCLWYEVNGKVYQFGANLKSNPEAVGPDGKGVSEIGLNMLAKGLPGKISIDDFDFKWVQNELDMAPLLASDMIQSIEAEIDKVMNGEMGVIIYQSRMRAQAAGIPIDSNSYNCTSFIGSLIGEKLNMELPEFMPIELFERLQCMYREKVNTCLGSIDCQLQQILNLSEEDLTDSFNKLAGVDLDLKLLTKPGVVVSEDISWEKLVEAVGLSTPV